MATRGKPFAKGADARRNAGGQRNKAAVQWTHDVRELLEQECAKTIKDGDGKRIRKLAFIVRVLVNKAMLGEEWAIRILLDRIAGKVKDELELSGTVGVKGYCQISPDDWTDDSNTGGT